MDADQAAGSDVRSPCTGVCTLDPDTGLCRGCLRTMAEIAGWPRLGTAEKRRVLDQLARRRAFARPAP